MDIKLELVILPVSDVDKSRDFYVQAGFKLDFDQTVSEEIRFVQLTPPGSACSIAFGKGLTTMEPGSIKGLQAVVDDAAAIREAAGSCRSRPASSTHPCRVKSSRSSR